MTFGIISVTLLISIYCFKNPRVTRRLIFNPYQVHTRWQYYRFLTSGFIHQDFSHLLLNMLSLYFFGLVVEKVFSIIFPPLGMVYFLGFYLAGIIVSGIPTYSKNKRNPGYNSLGASGGVASVIFASIIFQPLQPICIYFALCIPGFILGLLYLIGSYYQGKRAKDNINHDAHFYGALFGVLFCAVFYPSSIPDFFDQIAQWKLFR